MKKIAIKKAAAKKPATKKAVAKKAAAKPAAKKAAAAEKMLSIGTYLLCPLHHIKYPRGESCPRCT
jgi:hypothetical protein